MSDLEVRVNKEREKIELKLSKKYFDLFDSALACFIFIVFQAILPYILDVLPSVITDNFFGAFFVSLLVEAIFFFAGLIVAKIRKTELAEATGLNKKITWKTAFISIVIALISLYAFSSLTNVFVYSLEKLGYQTSMSEITIPNFLVYFVYVILLCVSPAFFEEFLFRGVILSGLKKYNKHMAVFVSALIFMLMHGGPDQTIHQFILGVVFGYVFLATRSLWPSIIMHFFNNFYAVTSLYIMGSSASTEVSTELPTWQELGLTLVIGIAIAAIGSYLIYLLIKSLKKKDDKKEKAEAILDGEISQEKLAELKAISSEEEQTLTVEQKKQEQSLKVPAIALYIASGLYLISTWVITLIQGF